MKVRYTTRNGRLTVELEGSTQREVFEQLHRFQEVFEDTVCSIDGESSDDVRFVVRKNTDGDEFYELRCNGPGKLRGYKKEFGCHKQGGGLFPRLKDREGNWISNNGWYKWQGNGSTKSEVAQTVSQGSEPF